MAGQLKYFIFISYSQSTIAWLLLAINTLTGVLMARDLVVGSGEEEEGKERIGRRERREKRERGGEAGLYGMLL